LEKLFSGEFWEFVLNYEGNLNGGIGIWVFLRICSGFHVGLLRRGDHLCVNLCIWRNFGAPLCCARGDINQGNRGVSCFTLGQPLGTSCLYLGQPLGTSCLYLGQPLGTSCLYLGQPRGTSCLYLGQGRGTRGLCWAGARGYFQDHLITN
jgi:hypothetical protein